MALQHTPAGLAGRRSKVLGHGVAPSMARHGALSPSPERGVHVASVGRRNRDRSEGQGQGQRTKGHVPINGALNLQ
jgi:hypothetical protein